MGRSAYLSRPRPGVRIAARPVIVSRRGKDAPDAQDAEQLSRQSASDGRSTRARKESEMSPVLTILLIVVAVLAGITLLGLFGDVVIGWVIFGIWAFVEAVAGSTARALRRLRPTKRRRSLQLAETASASTAVRLP